MNEQTKKFSEWIPALQGIAAYMAADFVKIPGKALDVLNLMGLTDPVITFGFDGGSPRYCRIEEEGSKPFQMAMDQLLEFAQVEQWEKEVGE